MANIRAGVAFIDIRLGSIDPFLARLREEVEKAGRDAGQRLGEEVSKSVPASAGKDIGEKLGQETSREFFNRARTDFGAGFRALASGQVETARNLFGEAGRSAGQSFVTGARNGFAGFESALDRITSVAQRMGTQVGNAAQQGWAKFQEFGQVLDKTAQRMGFLSFQIMNFGFVASAAFSAPTVAALGFASVIGIKTAAEIESATNALKYLLKPGYDVEALLKRLQRIAIESPIFDTADLIQYAQVFTAAGVEIDKTERFLKAFSNIALVTGTNTDKANLAIRAISQAFGKGKLQAEELNQQLGEAMPSVLKLLRDELGVTQKELNAMVKEGKITGDDLIAVFTRIGESEKFLKGAADGANTLNGTWQNFKETIQTQLGFIFLENAQAIKDAINELSPSLSQLIKDATPAFIGLIQLFKDIVRYFGMIVEWYSKLDPGTQGFIRKMIALGTIIGPIVIALGAFAGAFAGIVAGIAAIATPIGGVIALAVALGAAIAAAVYYLRKFLMGNSDTAKAIRTAWNGFYDIVIGPVVDAFRNLWTSILQAFNQIKNAIMGDTGSWKSWGGFLKELFTGVWALISGIFGLIGGVLSGIVNALGSLIKAIGSLISGIIKIFKGLTDFLVGVFTGDWDRALRGLKMIWDGLWDAIVGTLINLKDVLLNLVKGIVNGIINFFKNLYNVLVGNSIIPDMVNAIIKWFLTLLNKGTSLIRSLGQVFLAFYGAYIKPFVDRVIAGGNTVLNFFRNLPGQIRGALSGAAGWLVSTGRSIIEGLVSGIRSMGGYLKNSILNLIPGPVRSVVSNALGINSPSKVFKGYGENVVEGFVLGVASKNDLLRDSLHAFSDMPQFSQINGSPRDPLMDAGGGNAALQIENYYANDNVDPWRQAEDWHFIVTTRGGVS
jgi:tape measure domain-containing protein